MSIHLCQVQNYLDNHLVVQKADSVESLMEVLHDAYISHNSIESKEIREKFVQLRSLLPGIPPEQFDDLFSVVCDLCIAHEVLAFSQGVAVGMDLMTEVNRLP